MSYDKNDKLHIVAVTAAIRNDEGNYLILKRSENEKAFPGHWCFPGGKVENNHTVDEALYEEIKEETGLLMKSGKISLSEASFIRPDNQTVKVFVYLCEVENTEKVILENESFTEYLWIKAEEVVNYKTTNLENDLKKAEKIVQTGIDLSLLKTKSIKN